MNKYLLLALAVATVSVILLLWPSQRSVTLSNLPWQIETLPEGGSRVFGITLGETTAVEARRILNRPAEVGLFEGPQGDLSLEAFFGNVELGRIIARVIARLGADQQSLRRLIDGATGREPTPSGAYRFELSEPAIREVQQWPVVGITYSPTYARLDEQIVEARFGKPGETLAGADGQQLWLYPDLGLAIILAPRGRTLFEYVAPRDFGRLRERLDAQSKPEQGP